MSISDNISFILLAVIGLIFLIEFILNSRKKTIDKSVEKFVEKEKNIRKSSFKWLNWILDRKKNITLSTLLIIAIKIPLHYFFEKDNCKSALMGSALHAKPSYYCVEFKDFFNAIFSRYCYIDIKAGGVWEDVYLTGYLNPRLDLFIYITVVYLIVVWFFNDKIKAR